jgi:hypothetical protein
MSWILKSCIPIFVEKAKPDMKIGRRKRTALYRVSWVSSGYEAGIGEVVTFSFVLYLRMAGPRIRKSPEKFSHRWRHPASVDRLSA